MRRQSRIAGITGLVLFIGIWVLWPFIMYAADYEFSKPFFIGWVVVAIIWAFVALVTFTFLPLWEGRKTIARIVGGVVSGKGGQLQQQQQESVQQGRRGSEKTVGSSQSGGESIRTPGAASDSSVDDHIQPQ